MRFIEAGAKIPLHYSVKLVYITQVFHFILGVHMPWNESGDDKPKKDPWGNSKKPDNQNGPPDLDEALKQLKNKLNALLGGKKANKNAFSGGGSSSNDDGFNITKGLIIGLVSLVLIIWALSGIFIVSPAERGIILRLGKYTSDVGPGPHWIPRFIDTNYLVNVQRVDSYSYSSEMLTRDENIVSVSVAVQYRIANARDFLFNVTNPKSSLEQATASALRQVIGNTTLDEILTTGRETVRQDVEKQLQDILKRYNTGILIVDVNLQPAKPPEQVTDAFDDAIKAREDEQTYINKANAYERQVSAEAQGTSARLIQEAEAYRKEVILQAQADIANYLALLPQYQKSPSLTRERMYLGAMQQILGSTTKILLDQKSGSNLIYLPLQDILNSGGKKTSIDRQPVVESPSGDAVSQATSNELINRPLYPTREGSR